jgi:hypothetical protein
MSSTPTGATNPETTVFSAVVSSFLGSVVAAIGGPGPPVERGVTYGGPPVMRDGCRGRQVPGMWLLLRAFA